MEPLHSPKGASSAERHECSWKPHPIFQLYACKCGKIVRANTATNVKTRPDKDGYNIFGYGSRGNQRTLRAARIVIACFEGERVEEVDHKDRTRNNDAYDNLRYSSVSQNRRNVGVRKHSVSGIRNVRWREDKQRWQAYCRRDGKFKHLKYCTEQSEAQRIAEAHYGND